MEINIKEGDNIKSYQTRYENVSIFREAVSLCISPLIERVTLAGPLTDMSRKDSPVVHETDRCVRLFAPGEERLSFLLQKESAFTDNEKNLLEQVVRRLHGKRVSRPYTSRLDDMAFMISE